METYSKEFKEWMNCGNVIQYHDGYATKNAQYKNRLKSKRELYNYFVREFFEN